MADPKYQRILSQLRLAVLNDCGCKKRLSRAQEAARDAGLCTAEIDAAMRERSFDVRTSAVLALVCADKNSDQKAYDKAKKQALACGLTAEELTFFLSFARQLANTARISTRADGF